MQSHF